MSAVVQAVPSSDLSFWRTVYTEHGPAVLAFLRSRLGSRDDAEELLQETFVRAMATGGRLRDRSAVRPYLFTTAHNLLRNRIRRAQTSPLVEGVITDRAGPPSEAADARARVRVLVDAVARAVEAMPPAHRTAFQLGVLERLPYAEIARRTGWSQSAVKVNVFRARKQVLAELGDALPASSEVT